MNKIELINIDKAYGKDKPVIKGLNLGIKEGSFTILLGPSGCGKSTTLRMIAGLEKETGGDILIDGISVKNVEPGNRNIAMVFQNYALYPTMTVRGNIEFGLKNNKIPKDERERRIQEICEIVGLTEYLDRKPQSLSGGQRQRVALARSMVKHPSVFLMDEPLSNLDAKLRSQLRSELIELYHRLHTTFVYVTHDQVEAMSMGTDIVLLHQGKIMGHGSPTDIYHNPQNVFTAQFIGTPPMNIIECGQIDESIYTPKDTAYIGFRPEHARIVKDEEASSNDFLTLKGTIKTREMLGSEILYQIETNRNSIFVKQFDEMLSASGTVNIGIPYKKIYFFDKQQGRIKVI